MTLHTRKRHAVVGSDNDHGVLPVPALLQRRDQRPHLIIEGLDFNRVVEHVAAHGFAIGPIGWHVADILELFAYGDSGSLFVGSVWMVTAEPEKERFVAGAGCEKCGQSLTWGFARAGL